MENLLKKILTGMVILLVVIVAGGGLYLASMGGMNHGSTAAVNESGSSQKADTQKSVSTNNDTTNSDKAGDAQQQPAGQQPGGQQSAGESTGQQSGNGGQSAPPVIIQVQPPKTDPGNYLEQMKEKLRSINETNSSIASSSGGNGGTGQSGQAASPQNDMNQLHQNFYKLGKDIATMEQSLEKLSASIRDNQVPLPQQFSYTYPYSGSPYNNYPNTNNQSPTYPYNPNQSGQPVQPNQGQQPGQGNNQAGTVPDNSAHSGMTNNQMNHGLSLGTILNADSAKTLFTLLLLGSVVLAIISVVGFLTSLFKKEVRNQPGANQQTSV